jgi:hypothetical protein
MKAAGLRIRIEPELRDAFMATCHRKDMAAAQVIRSFIKDYVQQHQEAEASFIKSRKLSTKAVKKE